MKKLLILLTVVMLAATGCKKAETYCGVENPVNDIEWIREHIQKPNFETVEVYKQTYNAIEGIYVYSRFDSTKYYYISSYNACDGTPLYSGSSGFVGPNYPNDFVSNTSYKELIYSR